jgi:hypothetical protein
MFTNVAASVAAGDIDWRKWRKGAGRAQGRQVSFSSAYSCAICKRGIFRMNHSVFRFKVDHNIITPYRNNLYLGGLSIHFLQTVCVLCQLQLYKLQLTTQLQLHYFKNCIYVVTRKLTTWGSRKSRLTAVGIRCADYGTPSIRKSWQ